MSGTEDRHLGPLIAVTVAGVALVSLVTVLAGPHSHHRPPATAASRTVQTGSGGRAAGVSVPAPATTTAAPPAAAGTTSTTTPDATNPQALLGSFAPAFASMTYTDSNAEADWVSSWQADTTQNFDDLAQAGWSQLYEGALQDGSNVTGATVVSMTQLWATGAQTLWRVTVTRQVVSTISLPELDHAEQATWDFLLVPRPDGTYQIDAYSAPNPADSAPATYARPVAPATANGS